MTQPLLSIVIANYNYGRFLEEAIQSVVAQNMGDKVELIICDAASTDNSVDIIKKYANDLPPSTSYADWVKNNPLLTTNDQPLTTKITWWCSEKDGGQSSAFNKGFSHARGRYLTWLNADDILISGALRKVVAQMELHPECEWFTGNFVRFLPDGKMCEVSWGPHWYPSWLQTGHSPVVAFGPTTFFSKKIFDAAGGFYEDLHYIMDADLWERFMMHGVKQRRLNFYCWGFRMHEESKTAEFGDHCVSDKVFAAIREEKRVSLRRSGYSCSHILTFVNRIMRVLDGSFIRGMLLRRRFLGRSIKELCI